MLDSAESYSSIQYCTQFQRGQYNNILVWCGETSEVVSNNSVLQQIVISKLPLATCHILNIDMAMWLLDVSIRLSS